MSWMLTSTGRKMDLAEMDPGEIDIVDIAHHLAHLCRFTGACSTFYSVAEHSMLVSDLLARDHPRDYHLQLCGLLHDAHEAYLGDVSTPVKALLPDFREIDRMIWIAVARRFGLPDTLPPEVKRADLVALALERRDLMPQHPEPWPGIEAIEPPADMHATPRGWKPRATTREFLAAYDELQYLSSAESARA